MAVSFDSYADRLESAAGFAPSGSAYSVSVWFQRTANGYDPLWSVQDSGVTVFNTLEVDDFDEFLKIWDTGGETQQSAAIVADNTWYFAGFTMNAGDGSIYQAAAGSALTEYTSGGNPVEQITIDKFVLGATNEFTSELFSGRLAYVKVWNALLSFDEMRQEFLQGAPMRTADLYAFYPLLNDAEKLIDFSGNGRDLTNPGGAGSWTTVDGPPIPWRVKKRRIIHGVTLPAASVTSGLTRIHDLEGALTTVNIGSGGAAAANTDIFLQASQSAARRRSGVTLEGFWLDDGAGNDLSAADVHVGMWLWVTHYGQLTDLEVWLGDSTTNYDRHNFDYAAEYPKLGGWVRAWVDVSRTPEATGGAGGNEASIRYFGLVVSLPTVGGTTPNVVMDAIDQTTTGLSVTGFGGLWSTFTTADENTTNQYGVVRNISGVYYVRARLTLGSSLPLTFTDSNFTLVFPQQGLVADTFMGVTVDLQQTSTDVRWTNGSFSAPGTKKGDLIVTGTNGALVAVNCVFNGLRVITLTSKVTLTTCSIISTGLVTQAGATMTGCVFTNLTGSSNVLASNPGLITNSTFTSDGTGHALELNTPGTYALTNLTFTGYAAVDGSTGNEAIYNNSGGAVTLNVAGGNAPTIRNGAGASTTVNLNTVVSTITVVDISTGSAVSSARVLLLAANGTGPLPFEATVTISRSGSTATVSHTAHGLANGKKVQIKGAAQPEYNGVFTITYIDANSYSYTVSGTPTTPATGTIKATGVVLEGTTDGSGQISDTRGWSSAQPVTGRVRKATSGTLYKTGSITGTISTSAGFSATVQLIRDE